MQRHFHFKQFSSAYKDSSISNNSVQHTKTFPFQTIQFSIQRQFYFKQFSSAYKDYSFSNNSIQHKKTVPFQTIQFSMQRQFYFKQFSSASKTVLFQTIQFNKSSQFSATIPSQSGPGSYGNDEVLHTPQSSSITGHSRLDCLGSYPRHSLGGDVLPLCAEAVGVFYRPSLLGNGNITVK